MDYDSDSDYDSHFRHTSPNVPSLKELAGKRVHTALGQSREMASALASLEPGQQEVVFRLMRGEIKRLHTAEKQYRTLSERSPPSDLHVIKHPFVRLQEEDDWVDGFARNLKRAWKWGNVGETFSAGHRWGSMELLSLTPDSKFGICRLHKPGTCRQFYYQDSPDAERDPFCGITFPGRRCTFSARISSQLLLYRLCAVFGMPPAQVADEYKVCWEGVLCRRGAGNASKESNDSTTGEDEENDAKVGFGSRVEAARRQPRAQNFTDDEDDSAYLFLGDWEGGATISFSGDMQFSDEAVQLVNFLVSPVCPHTYDGVIAGRVA
jgi:hypothetical protein